MPIIRDTAPVFFPDKAIQISKYIDLVKFISILYNKALFFCRLDKLEDQFEGKTAERNFAERFDWFKEAAQINNRIINDKDIIENVKALYDYQEKMKETTCICCWNKAEEESAALWKIYSDFGKGIMIKSSVSNIIESFAATNETLRMSEVKYINYQNDRMSDGNIYFPLIHKQSAYKYEEEIRLIHEVGPTQIGKNFDWSKEEIKEGKLLKVDLNILIDEIIIGPYSPKWILNLIEDLIGKYSLKKPVRFSTLTI